MRAVLIYVFDDFELDSERRELRFRSQIVEAEAMAIRLLACLVEHQGSVVTKDELIDAVWEGRALADNAITVCMARLRKVLRRHAGSRTFVTTVYGQGYRFVHPVHSGERTRGLSVPPALHVAHDSNPCVGRERVLERLARLRTRAIERRGAACAVMGTAGVGKTRVLEAFERRIEPEQTVVWAYCRDSGTAPPLSPWRRLLETLLVDGIPPELAHALGPHAPALKAWLGLAGDTELEEAAKPQLGVRNPAFRRTFEAILRTLSWLSDRSPLCLVLDDLHRADAASLELLLMLLDEIAHTHILVLCTVRQTEGRPVRRSDTHLPAILGHRNCERLPLSPLGRDDVAAYAQARLGEVSAELIDAILVGSDGIPFFMVELVRKAETEGPLDASSLTVPTAALELFRGRVAGLSELGRTVLRAASVVGRTFELPLLQDASDLSPADVLAGIDEAIACDIVVAAPGSASAFAFEHELMRRAVYEAIPITERRKLHLRVASALEQRGIVSDQLTHALAYHLHAALPEGDPGKTTHYCQAAAWTAGGAFAYPDAVTHLNHALEALELKPEAQPRRRAHLYLMKAMYSRGQVGFREALDAVRHLGYQLGDADLMAQAAFMYNPHPLLQPIADARGLLEYALTVTAPTDGISRARLLSCLAGTAPGCFDKQLTEARLSEARALADKPENIAAQYAVGLARLHLLCGPRQPDARTEQRRELLELARSYPDFLPVLPIDLALDEAIEAMQDARTPTADAALDRAARLARAINHRELQWHIQRMRAWASIDHSSSGQGMSELTQLHRRADRKEVVDLELFCAFDRCMLALDAGITPDLDDADLLALAHEPADPVHVWAMKVRALAAMGLAAEAREALHMIPPERISELPSGAQVLGSLAQLAKAAIALDEYDHARALQAALVHYPEHIAVNIAYRCEGAVAQVLGELSTYFGDPVIARNLLRQAVEIDERAGLVRCADEARDALRAIASAS